MLELDPALTVPCPTCKAGRNEPCISRHAIRIHAARRAALRALSTAADRLIREGDTRSGRRASNERGGQGGDFDAEH
jgi:hypothetical protein